MRLGCVIDFTELDEHRQPYDLSRSNVRKRVTEIFRVQQRCMLVVGPPRTVSSSLRVLTNNDGDPEIVELELKDGIEHVKFAIELCHLQRRKGRKVMLEHPANVVSWRLDCVQSLFRTEGVNQIKFEFCTMGMMLEDEHGSGPVKKRTGIILNSESITSLLNDKQADGKRRYAAPMEGRTTACEV